MPGIEPRVLHHYRPVGFDQRSEVGVARQWLRILEVVEAQVQRAARGNRYPVGADRFAVGEVQGDGHVCVVVAGVEEARGLVGDERRVVVVAVAGDVAFGDRPGTPANGHQRAPGSIFALPPASRRPSATPAAAATAQVATNALPRATGPDSSTGPGRVSSVNAPRVRCLPGTGSNRLSGRSGSAGRSRRWPSTASAPR